MRTNIVIIATHYLNVWRYCPEILIGLFITDVPSTYYLLDFARNLIICCKTTWLSTQVWGGGRLNATNKKFLKLCWQVVNPIRDMKIADDEDEDHSRCSQVQMQFGHLLSRTSAAATSKLWTRAARVTKVGLEIIWTMSWPVLATCRLPQLVSFYSNRPLAHTPPKLP